MATLFSYFSKVSNKSKEKTSPKAGDKVGSQNSASPKETAKENGKTSPSSSTKPNTNTKAPHQDLAPGDLVWSRLEGYPWWPSLVCDHPTLAKCTKREGRKDWVHVQFFDDPPSRAWISAKFVEEYTGSGAPECQFGRKFHTTKPDVRRGMDQADDALKKKKEERLELIVCQVPSEDEDDDEEEEEEEEEEMEVNAGDASEDEVPSGRRKPRAAAKKAMATQKNKRRRIMVASDSDSDSSGDEFKPGSDADSDDGGSSGVDEDEMSEAETESDPETPKKSKKRKRSTTSTATPATNRSGKTLRSVLTPPPLERSSIATPPPKKTFGTPTVGSSTKARLSAFQSPAPSSSSSPTPVESDEARYTHQRLDWLKPGKRKDGKGRVEQDPDYDPSTLWVPRSFMEKCTPAMRQWWEMKSKYFDTVLFFKMGKFYEFYHTDAEVGVKELGLIFMKGDHAHSGFPEIAYSRYSDTLIQKGYRVARVEQTETPDMMQDRVKHMSAPTKFDKVVKREICRIATKATRTYSFIDGDTCEAQSSYLLAVTERPLGDGSGGESVYGVCFVETSIGKFYIGQFADDRHGSRFRTLIAHHPPSQVLFERGKLLPKTHQLLSTNLVSVLKDALAPNTEFWEAPRTLKTLAEKGYFEEEEGGKDGEENGVMEMEGEEERKKEGLHAWPAALKEMLSDVDALGLTPREGCELAISALGACTWYLKKCCLEQELLSLRNFETYKPLDAEATKPNSPLRTFAAKQHMVLDSITLSNLDILENGSTGTREGTLLETLDHCRTPFGKRLFQQWLCTPLCNPKSINDRLDAVEDLHGNADVAAEVAEVMKKLPDLERLLSKIHTLGSSKRNADHPDSRAIFFEDAVYSKRKINDFITALEGFENGLKIVRLFRKQSPDFKSKLLKACVSLQSAGSGGKYPNYGDTLEFFEHAFDQKKAKETGSIIPCKGVIPEYDRAISDIATAKQTLQDYLEKQRKRLGCKTISFWGTAKNRFQMEIPESALKRYTPEEYELQSSKKGFKRYWTPTIQKLLADTMNAEDRRDGALKDSMRRVFHKFDEHYKSWDAAIQCLSVLDVLMSLAEYSRSGDGTMSRPEIVLPSQEQQPYIAITEGRHPCIAHTFSGGDYIPNDTFIGIQNDDEMDEGDGNRGNSSCILVTGPNMGGKSTLMRQAGLIVVMAQLGCYVPAEGCRMTPVDRVFTRLGARDNILSGESTFFVELSETASILKHATKHSLVLVDELGRGTATYDGTAIATAVVKELSEVVGCRTLFSTHYHSLVEEFSHDPNIRLGHMACMVENENEEDPSQETITFLYKFVGGACPKSYGFNAAQLADIPDEIIHVARRKARQFEESAERMKFFRTVHKMCRAPSTVDISRLKQLVARV